jgi:hypothetical protein
MSEIDEPRGNAGASLSSKAQAGLAEERSIAAQEAEVSTAASVSTSDLCCSVRVVATRPIIRAVAVPFTVDSGPAGRTGLSVAAAESSERLKPCSVFPELSRAPVDDGGRDDDALDPVHYLDRPAWYAAMFVHRNLPPASSRLLQGTRSGMTGMNDGGITAAVERLAG